ncbi:MAG: asparagine synthase-related protein, partial [Desulfobaccales bacterium]
QTARHFGARHQALLINPRSGRLLPFVASQMDEPIADPSALATYLICRRARQEVTVLLTGDGSDELLLGYPRYRLHALSQALTQLLPFSLRKSICRHLPPHSLIERTLSAPQDPLLRDRYWLGHGQRRLGAFSRAERRMTIEEAVQDVLREDLSSWLVEDILVKIDKMSMAASVELRAPFLDQDVANLVLNLPLRTRLGFRQGKLVLAEAMRDLLPGHIAWSRKKPFHLPIDDWLRSEWRPLLQDVLLDSRTRERGWVEAREIHRLIDEHLKGAASHGRRLYQLLVLELWARSILDRGASDSHPADVGDCARELDPARPIHWVAVIAPAGIGDTLRLTPAIRQLDRTDPNVSMTLYVAQGRGADQVMAGLSPVERQVPIDFTRSSLEKIFALVKDIRKNPPDLLISTWISRLAWLVAALSGVKDRRGWVPQWSWSMRWGGLFWKQAQPYDPQQRDVGRQDILAFCDLLGVPPPATLTFSMARPLWEESSLARARVKLGRLPRPLLAVNAIAQPSIRQRQYPLVKLGQALTELLHRRTISAVVLLGDTHSRSCHEPLRSLLGPRCLDLSGDLT